MFAISFDKYLDKLDQSTIKRETDILREAYSNSIEGIVVQRILGNFWEHPSVKENLTDIVKVLSEVKTKKTSFVNNRFALLMQLKNNPHLTGSEKLLIDGGIKSICDGVKESVYELISCTPDSDMCRWIQGLRKKDINESTVSYLTLGLNDKSHNLAAHILMNYITPLSLNFDCFSKHPMIVDCLNAGILKAIEDNTSPKNITDWLSKEYLKTNTLEPSQVVM